MPKTTNSGFFDISTPEIFFQTTKKAIKDLDESKFKSSEKLMFIVMGLNHLREWIAPNYDHNQKATNPAEDFFNHIFALPEYKTINSLCNSSKHLSKFNGTASVVGNVPIDEWDSIDSVINFDIGPLLGYVVDGQDVRIIIEKVIQFYDKNWFNKSHPPCT